MGTEDSSQRVELNNYTLEEIIEGEVSFEDLTIDELLDIHLELVREKNRIRDLFLNEWKTKLKEEVKRC